MKEARERFDEATSAGEIVVIPEPDEIIETGFAERIREELQKIENVTMVEEAQRRLLALENYVRDKARQDEVRAACRHAEVRIGELLGPAQQTWTGKKSASSASYALSPNELYQFRQMAANQDIVRLCIANRTTSRSAILAAIKKKKAEEATPITIKSHANGKLKLDIDDIARKAISFLTRELENATFEEKLEVLTSILNAMRICSDDLDESLTYNERGVERVWRPVADAVLLR